MKISASTFAIGSILLLSAAELVPLIPARIGLLGDAQAVVGRPMTPVSYAGVARRTAVRTTAVVATAAVATTAVVATSAATSQAAASQAAASQAAAAQAASAARPPAPVPGAGPLPVGTVVAALPGGCVSAPIGGQEYYLCNGTYYRAAFQSNNLVYVVAKP